MTAATVEASLATTLRLEHDSAIRLADQLEGEPVDVRRPAAARALLDRLADLKLLRTLLVERDGTAPSLERLVAGDQLYADLTILAIA
jgi:hypothetical protein